MRKYLIILAFMMLLMPIMHACSDDGSNGSGGGIGPGGVTIVPAYITIDKTEINLGDVAIGDNKSFEFTVTNVTNESFKLRLEAMINSTDLHDADPDTKKEITDCNDNFDSLYMPMNPLEVCLIKVSFIVTKPLSKHPNPSDNRPIRNAIDLSGGDEASMTWWRVVLPIIYEVK